MENRFFKIILLIVLLSVSVFGGSCWKIKNRDMKAMCEATY